MLTPPVSCLNAACRDHERPRAGNLQKRGVYRPQYSTSPIQRYRCRTCGVTCSDKTSAADRGQKKPQHNDMLFKALHSGVGLRDAAKVFGLAYNTVCSRFRWLAMLSREAHATAMGSLSMLTSCIQLDEMESYEHSRHKPLTIALAIRQRTGEILGVAVGRIPSKRPSAAGVAGTWVVNESADACFEVLSQARRAARRDVTVLCDGKSTYPDLIHASMSYATVKATDGHRGGGFNPLFRIDNLCAKIRNKLSRMARRTWSTTKDRARLRDHLDIFVARQNGYNLHL